MILDLTNLSVNNRKLLNKTSIEIHDDFNKLTEDIIKATRGNVVDLVSNIASRHSYQSGLYKICYTIAFILQIKEDIKEIRTDDIELFEAIKQLKLSKNIVFIGSNKIKQKIKFYFRPMTDFIRIGLLIKRELTSRIVKRRDHVKKIKSLILIDTFFLMNSIKKGEYIDRYYTGILKYLDEANKKGIYFVPEILAKYSRKDLKKIEKNSEENILYKCDFLKILDYIKIINLLVMHRINKKNKFYFRKFDLTHIVVKQSKLSKFNGSSFGALKNYFFVKRLKSENVNLKLVIDWNENQPIDKGLIRGVHDFFPNIKVKGYRGFVISHNYNLYLSPTSYEVKNKVIPDEIGVICKNLIKETKRFYEKINITLAPAFRFMDIHQSISAKKKEGRILVALPIGLNSSINILEMLLEVKQQHLIEKYQYLIKPHPSFKIEKLKKTLGSNWLTNFELVDGKLKDSLIRSSLFISNSSSAILESLAYGVPGIIVAGKNTVVQNPIPESVNQKIWKLVYTQEELSEAINFYMSTSENDKEEFYRIGDEVKEDFFMPVTKEKVKEFLKI